VCAVCPAPKDFILPGFISQPQLALPNGSAAAQVLQGYRFGGDDSEAEYPIQQTCLLPAPWMLEFAKLDGGQMLERSEGRF
jgi:hypothetical protein